jgi:hypothetical protein
MVNGPLTQATPGDEKNPWENGFTGSRANAPCGSVAGFGVVDSHELELHTAIMMKMKESISLDGRAG